MTLSEAKALLEAVIFVSGDPITTRELCRALDMDEGTVTALISEVAALYEGDDRGVRLLNIGGGWQFCSRPELAPAIAAVTGDRKAAKLSQAALETLAIVAYRQPVTKAEMEGIRGVGVDGVVGALVDRDLIMEVGRKDAPGRPILYGVTPRFLRHFGLSCAEDMPRLDELEIPGDDGGMFADLTDGYGPAEGLREAAAASDADKTGEPGE